MQTISDLMTTNLLTVDPRDLVGGVRDLMLDSGIHCLPVVDNEGHPLGVVTSWDLVEEYAPEESVVNAMSSKVVTVGPDEPLSQAAAVMMSNWIHHLVVVDDHARVQGVLSSFDLLGLVAESQVV